MQELLNVKIRKVRQEDLPAVARIESICFPKAEAASLSAFEKRWHAFPECFFAAESDGMLIGFINGCCTDEMVIRDEMFEDSTLHKKDGCFQSIFGLDVLPEHQHKGVAAALMKHLIADAKKKGRKGLILTCKEHLIPFYEKFGYQNRGISASTHGGAVWYDMILVIE